MVSKQRETRRFILDVLRDIESGERVFTELKSEQSEGYSQVLTDYQACIQKHGEESELCLTPEQMLYDTLNYFIAHGNLVWQRRKST